MFAVIKTGGKQYRVKEGDVLCVEKLNGDEGQKIFFSQVLLIEDGKNTLIGTPYVENARVGAEIIENFKDKKVIVFKKKRRKQFRRKRGHRQELTRIKIEEVALGAKAAPLKELALAIKKEKEKEAPKKRPAAKEAGAKIARQKKPGKEEKKEVEKEVKAQKEPQVLRAEKSKKALSEKKARTRTGSKADK